MLKMKYTWAILNSIHFNTIFLLRWMVRVAGDICRKGKSFTYQEQENMFSPGSSYLGIVKSLCNS